MPVKNLSEKYRTVDSIIFSLSQLPVNNSKSYTGMLLPLFVVHSITFHDLSVVCAERQKGTFSHQLLVLQCKAQSFLF
jgi:hypothetical protein